MTPTIPADFADQLRAGKTLTGLQDQINTVTGEANLADQVAQVHQQVADLPAPPDIPDVTPKESQAAPATTAALQAGASQQELDNARAHLGEQAYVNYCEQFVENMGGKNGVYPSAKAAWDAQQPVARTDVANMQPGDHVYFAPDASNGGYGHVGIYAGNGQFISATANGVRQVGLNDWQKLTGQQLLGYVPGTGANAIPGADGQYAGPPTPPGLREQPPAAPGKFATLDSLGQHVQDFMGWARDTLGAGDTGQGVAAAHQAVQALPATVAHYATEPLSGVEDVVRAMGGTVPTDEQQVAGLTSGLSETPSHDMPEVDQMRAQATSDVARNRGLANAMLGVASGGPEGIAAPVVAAKAGGSAVANAFRTIADAFEGGVPGLRAGEAAMSGPGAMRASGPGLLDRAESVTGKIGEWGNNITAPIENAPLPAQPLLTDYANAINSAPHYGVTKGLQARDILGPENDTAESAMSYMKTGQFSTEPPVVDGMIRLYRQQHEPFNPAQVSTPGDMDRGRWFSSDPNYLSGIFGDQRSYVDVPVAEYQDMLANETEIARLLGDQRMEGATSVLLDPALARQAQPLRPTGHADLASNLRDYFKETGDTGREAGYIRGDASLIPGGDPYYFPRAYENGVGEAEEAAPSYGASDKNFNPRNTYTNGRVFPSIDDAVGAGFKPVDSVSEPLARYETARLVSDADVALKEGLLKTENSGAVLIQTDPEKFAAAQDSGYNVVDRMPHGWVPGSKIDNSFAGMAFDPALAKPLANMVASSALRQGELSGVFQALGAAKEGMLLSGFHGTVEGAQAMRNAIALDGAHGLVSGPAMLSHGVLNVVNDGAMQAWRLRRADWIHEATNEGGMTLFKGGVGPDITGARGTATIAGHDISKQIMLRAGLGGVSGGATGEELARQHDMGIPAQVAGLVGGAVLGGAVNATIGTAVQKALWERWVPTLKVESYIVARKAGYSPEAAGKTMNNLFGGQNLLALARSPNWQEAARQTFLAPDWLESWAKNAGAAFGRGATAEEAEMARKYWAVTLGAGALAIEPMNILLSGHTTLDNEPGHQFQLEVTGHFGFPTDKRTYLDILQMGPVGSAMNAASFAAKGGGTGEEGLLGDLLQSHAGLAPRIAETFITGKQFGGKDILPTATPPRLPGGARAIPTTAKPSPLEYGGAYGAAALKNTAPLGIQQMDKQDVPPWFRAASLVTGVRASQVKPPPFRGPAGRSVR